MSSGLAPPAVYSGSLYDYTDFGRYFAGNWAVFTPAPVAIPEPGTLALLGIAGSAFAIVQQRRRRNLVPAQ